MHTELYADNFDERVQERMMQVQACCEGCGVRRGALRLGRRSHEFYFVALHGAHPNHDPHNPEAEIRIWCPACHMRYDRESEQQTASRPRRRRQGYHVISVERLIALAQSAGIQLHPVAEGYCCQVLGVKQVLPDVVSAFEFGLHCLMMETLRS